MSERERVLNELDPLLAIKDPRVTSQWYQKNAQNYDQYMRAIGYTGVSQVIDEFLKLGLSRDIRILDIGAGTGAVGALLHRNGYTNIDALDATPAMLERAAQRKCYHKTIVSFVTKDTRLPIDDRTYDAVFLCGCVCPGYIALDSFRQVIRIVKPGGYILWCSGFYEKFGEEFHNENDRHLKEYCDEGLWHKVPGYPMTMENYLEGITSGRVFIMKVL